MLKITMMSGSFDRLLGAENMAQAIDVAKIVDEAGLYGIAIGEHVSLSSSLEGYPYQGGLRYGDQGRKPYLEPAVLHGGDERTEDSRLTSDRVATANCDQRLRDTLCKSTRYLLLLPAIVPGFQQLGMTSLDHSAETVTPMNFRAAQDFVHVCHVGPQRGVSVP